jgi:radical SAM superfamily enzyme YgiQ (UPF0313 family)
MKLGLIAMSGVRADNEEITKLGLTLPGFVERGKVIASLPSLGLLTLASLTPSEFEIDYVEIVDIQEQKTLKLYDLVAISSFTAQIKQAYILADRYRAVGTKVLMGGLHVSALPEEALAHADAVILGEGELIWESVMKDFLLGDLKSIYDMRGKFFDLAHAPMPRFDLLDMEKYNRITVQTQRGCPFSCDFCASSIRLSPKFKVKPIEKVIAEIRMIKSLWKKPFIEFADDNTFADKRHAKKLLKALAKEKIKWFTETDISIAYDNELLDLLKKSGCVQVLIGFESISQSALEGVETHSNWKAKQVHSYIEAIAKIQSYGITVNGCFILGLDGTGEESFRDVFEFVEKSSLYEVQVTLLTPFPNTPLYERFKAENRLIDETAWEKCTLFDVNFYPDTMSVQSLEEHFKSLIEQLYSKEATSKRKAKYREILKG